MSLLTQASSFNTENFSSGKRQARMKGTFENIKREQVQYLEPMTSTFGPDDDSKSRNEHIQKLINERQPDADSDGSALHHYNPIPKDSRVVPQMPSLSKAPEFPATTSENVSVSRESFMNPASIHKSHGSSYSQSYIPTPYYKGLSSSAQVGGVASSMQSSQLMEKLNYMIHLLEEQQKEPTQNIMEEFVLYGLLGVFMIYMVDSFARAGKYIR